MIGHEAWCPRCEQAHCCVIEVRHCAELAKLTPYAGPQVSDEDRKQEQ